MKCFRFLNDARALQRAKENVERYFSVVGVLEELNATLSVLENRLPRFFKNVQDIYYNELLRKYFLTHNSKIFVEYNIQYCTVMDNLKHVSEDEELHK